LENVSREKKLGGLGIMNLEKYAMTLRLRLPWLEWTCLDKIWVGYGNSCTCEDMDIFYDTTTITIGNDSKAPFWQAPWLGGRKLIDIAPLIFASSKQKIRFARQCFGP
jgi:hypothetical protein